MTAGGSAAGGMPLLLRGSAAWRAAFLQERHQDCSPSWLCSRRKKSAAAFRTWHLLHGLDSTVGVLTTGRAACHKRRQNCWNGCGARQNVECREKDRKHGKDKVADSHVLLE